ncbi:MAG: DUF2752 domain-containing protein [Roseburia sp.]|nr:DUF2752 domain-containing protein [Roseburia sp.]
MIRKRFFHVLFVAILLFSAGAAYGKFFYRTGIGIPCPIRALTGLKCSGCGVTHMCASLLHFDFEGAFAANPALLLLSPLLVIIFSKYVIDYIRTGRWQMSFVQNVIVWFCICVLVLYGIGRNIFSIP